MEDQGVRLDLFLTQKDTKYSRSVIKKLIVAGGIEVNGTLEYRANYKVKEGDNVTVDYSMIVDDPSDKDILPEKINLRIVYEDEHLLVIDKPAGMVTHPATGNWTGTLMNGVVHYSNEVMATGGGNRAGLIHRLDKDTSGLIMIGKTNKGLWYYSRLFAERNIKKTYIAVAKGLIKEGKFTVRGYLGRNRRDRKKFSMLSESHGKYSETKFIVQSRTNVKGHDLFVVTASPITGRTHQIRVHLQSKGYPILGDPIYSRSKNNRVAERLMLHAWKLKFQSIDGRDMLLEAELPKEFEEFIS